MENNCNEVSEVVIRMPKYNRATNGNAIVSFSLGKNFIKALRPGEKLSIPVEQDCELKAKCNFMSVELPLKAGKRTVVDVSFTSFGSMVLSEEGKDPEEDLKCVDPILVISAFFMVIAAFMWIGRLF